MATQWSHMTRFEPRSWLLTNGDIITEPALEISGTGLKFRVAGSTDSVFRSDFDAMVRRGAENIAAERGASLWIETTNSLFDQIQTTVGSRLVDLKANLHTVHDPGPHKSTRLWWRYQDTATPYEALVLVTVRSLSNTVTHSITVEAVLPSSMVDGTCTPEVIRSDDAKFFALFADLPHTRRVAWTDMLEENKTNLSPVLGTTRYADPHSAIEALLNIVRTIEDLESIQVPDIVTNEPALRTLDLIGTNVNAAFISDMTEYLDSAPLVEVAADLYRQLLEALRQTGISVDTKSSNDFLSALLSGQPTLGMKVNDVVGETDQDHKVSVHLPTGTFIVECLHRAVNKNEVAEAWDEAHTMASITGEEDVLLAYARGYVADRQTARTKEILAGRGAI